MKSITIIISHFESLPFLRACIRQIRKHTNPEIFIQRIIIADQSSADTELAILEEFGDYDCDVIGTKPLYSGYGIDYLMREGDIDTDYVCQLHVDAFPISDKWLSLPIQLMQENNLAFTGVLQFICDKPQPIYPFKNPFFAMAQCFNIGRTDVYKEMSLNGGFTRYHNRPASGLTFLNKDWDEWAKEDYNARGSDDDVPAFYWQDTYRQDNKMSFGLTGKIGIHGQEAGFGAIIEDLVFHFGYHREGLGVMEQMGQKYAYWSKRIAEGYTDDLIAEMLKEARKQPFKGEDQRIVWDGVTKTAKRASHSLNKRIKELKDGVE